MSKKAKQRLTPKQKRFVDEYLKDRNATAAAGRAGYNPDWGRHLYAKPHIREAIEQRVERVSQRADITAQRVLEELARLAFSNMLDYVRITEDGETFVDLSGVSRDQAAAIQEVTVENHLEGRGDDARTVRRVRFKLAGKEGPLEKLGKYLGLFSDNPPMQPGTEVTEIKRTIVRAASPKE